MKPLLGWHWPTSAMWCWTFISQMLVGWWLANILPILACWTKRCWPNIGLPMFGQCFSWRWPSIGPILVCVTWNHCWANIGPPIISNVGPLLIHCWYGDGQPTLCLHWPTGQTSGQTSAGSSFTLKAKSIFLTKNFRSTSSCKWMWLLFPKLMISSMEFVHWDSKKLGTPVFPTFNIFVIGIVYNEPGTITAVHYPLNLWRFLPGFTF